MFFERHAEELVEHFVPEKSDRKEVSSSLYYFSKINVEIVWSIV